MLESRHATGVASGASRGNRNYVTARGVRDADAAFRACDLAGERPDRGSGRRGGVVSPALSHRKEARARMAAITFHVARRTLPVLAGLAVAAPLPGQTSLSIYSDGRVVVRRTLPQGLEKGRNTLTLRLEGLDPATLFSPYTSVALVSAALRPPTERGAATILSQSLRADSADVQIVAGSSNRAPRAPQPKFDYVARGVAAVEAREEASFASEQAVGEAHVYQLPGRVSFAPAMPVTTALFPRATVAYAQEFVVPGVLPWRGFVGPMPTEPNRVPVQVWYTVKRARGTAFGDRPLPGGTVQLYQADSGGRVQLVGEARSDHTAPGRDLRVQSGEAFDVTAERVQTEYNQEQIPPPKRGLAARQRITAAYRVMISNAKPEAVTVDVRESHYGTWHIVESSVPAEKLSATEVRFRLPVPANGAATLTYTVQAES